VPSPLLEILFSRFEKTAKNFAGMIKMAFIQRYLKTTR